MIPFVVGIVEKNGKILVVEYVKNHKNFGGLLLPPIINYPYEDEGNEAKKLTSELLERLGVRFVFNQSKRGRIFNFSHPSRNITYRILPFKGDLIQNGPFQLSSDYDKIHWMEPCYCLQTCLKSLFFSCFDQFGIK